MRNGEHEMERLRNELAETQRLQAVERERAREHVKEVRLSVKHAQRRRRVEH
jgi:hypothetical protein